MNTFEDAVRILLVKPFDIFSDPRGHRTQLGSAGGHDAPGEDLPQEDPVQEGLFAQGELRNHPQQSRRAAPQSKYIERF